MDILARLAIASLEYVQAGYFGTIVSLMPAYLPAYGFTVILCIDISLYYFPLMLIIFSGEIYLLFGFV